MSITFKCRDCGAEYRLQDELVGKRVKCKCGRSAVVPADESLPATTASFIEDELAATPSASSAESDATSNDGDYVVGDVDRLTYPVHEYLEEALRKRSEKEAKKFEPTAFPMFVGVFEYPWHVDTLSCWIPMSLLMLVAGGMQAFLFTYGVQLGMIGVRTVGVSAFIATVVALAYAGACSMSVIEETANGNATVEQWPSALQWKEWAWGFVFLLAMWIESAFFAFIPTFFLTPWTVLPTIALTFVIFPIVLLASSEADSWAPVSPTILGSLQHRPALWVVFYVEYFAVLAGWCVAVVLAAFAIGWWALLVICPLLAAVILIQSRLIGRLAWCIGKGR